MTIELPHLHSPLRPPSPAGPSDLDWSEADEIAALGTVWDSLCQDAVTSRPPVQLPVLPAPRQFPAPARVSRRRRARRGDGRGRQVS